MGKTSGSSREREQILAVREIGIKTNNHPQIMKNIGCSWDTVTACPKHIHNHTSTRNLHLSVSILHECMFVDRVGTSQRGGAPRSLNN